MKYERYALIPAYCPDERLIGITEELIGRGFKVIILNDGSGSSYRHIFEAVSDKADVLVHIHNHGKGAALRTGLSYISENFQPPYAVVTMDADGQHKVEDAERIIEQACNEPDSLILGSREFKGRVPLRSIFGNTVTRFVFRIASGAKVYDTQTGLRAFTHRSIGRMLAVSGDRYEYEMNVLMNCVKQNMTITEIPIETIYIGKNESSHFDTVHDSYRIYKEILKFSASSLLCFGIDYTLFCLFSALCGSVSVSNISARILSATANYNLNKRFVFRGSSSAKKSAVQYFALAAMVLVCNTALLNLLVAATPLNRYSAKLITEITMFTLSWAAQHCFIFSKKTKESSVNG